MPQVFTLGDGGSEVLLLSSCRLNEDPVCDSAVKWQMLTVMRFVCCRGTHGYMAPEVLQKGTAYDSSADWFSLGCMLFKLLRG